MKLVDIQPRGVVTEFLPIPDDEEVELSQNLLEAFSVPHVIGMNYASPQSLSGEEKRQADRGRGRKAYSEKRDGTRVTRLTASPWDMILPILKPPLVLEFPSQLDLPSELYGFQLVGVQRLMENRRGFLLADEMGTGKTVMSCVALRVLLQQGLVERAVVVCPKSMVRIWDEHIRDWCGMHVRCTVVEGPPQTRVNDWRCPAHVYVASYDILRRDVLEGLGPFDRGDASSRFDLVILDEAHNIRNPSSGRSRAILALHPRYRWALTGTPLQNRIEDLAAIFRFVKPGHFPSQPVSPAEAKELVKPYFLRRLKCDVLTDLPDKVRQDIWLEMDPAQREAYEDLLGREREAFKGGRVPVTRMHIFALLQKLKQICNFAPGAVTSPKSDQLLEQLDEIVDEHKGCIFTEYVEMGILKLKPLLEPYGLAVHYGATSDSERRKAIKAFREDSEIRVFLATPATAGEGITLVKGNYVFHFDQWWNPARAWQAEDRLHRKGQRKQVTVYSYWMQDTYEERLHEILRRKGLLHEEVVNAMSESEIESAVSIEEWCEILGLDVSFSGSHPAGAAVQQGRGGQSRSVPQETPSGTIGEVYETLSRVTPKRFEELVAEMLKRMGHQGVRVTGRSHDGGIDIIAWHQDVGGRRDIVVQCKRKSTVGVEVARELLGVVSSNPKFSQGLLVVSGKVSDSCREFIGGHGALSVIEGFELAKRLLEFAIPLEVE